MNRTAPRVLPFPIGHNTGAAGLEETETGQNARSPFSARSEEKGKEGERPSEKARSDGEQGGRGSQELPREAPFEGAMEGEFTLPLETTTHTNTAELAAATLRFFFPFPS